MSLIATLSLIGFDSVFVHFLPTTADRNHSMNAGITLVGGTVLVLSVGFIALVGYISPSLAFIQHNIWYSAAFIIACLMTAINILTDAIFLANRRAEFTLIINTVFSIVKMILPFAFVPWGAVGIFTAAALAQTTGCLLSLVVMMWKFGYVPKMTIGLEMLKGVWRYSAANYFAGIFTLLPSTVLPIIIINKLGAPSAAYFYIAMMIGNLLYAIPTAVARSLFAESSNDLAGHQSHLQKSLRDIALLMLPAMLVLLMAGKWVLMIFGNEYATSSIGLLRIIVLSAISFGATGVFASMFRITKNLRALVVMNIVYAFGIIGLGYALIQYGLLGIGGAWFLGNTLTAFVAYFLYRGEKRKIKRVPIPGTVATIEPSLVR
jgi:O-antigen/teichoic acid export membrane protein